MKSAAAATGWSNGAMSLCIKVFPAPQAWERDTADLKADRYPYNPDDPPHSTNL